MFKKESSVFWNPTPRPLLPSSELQLSKWLSRIAERIWLIFFSKNTSHASHGKFQVNMTFGRGTRLVWGCLRGTAALRGVATRPYWYSPGTSCTLGPAELLPGPRTAGHPAAGAYQSPLQFEVPESRSPSASLKRRLLRSLSQTGEPRGWQSEREGATLEPRLVFRLTRQFDSFPRLPQVPRPTLRATKAERNLTAPITNQKRGLEPEPIGAG